MNAIALLASCAPPNRTRLTDSIDVEYAHAVLWDTRIANRRMRALPKTVLTFLGFIGMGAAACFTASQAQPATQTPAQVPTQTPAQVPTQSKAPAATALPAQTPSRAAVDPRIAQCLSLNQQQALIAQQEQNLNAQIEAWKQAYKNCVAGQGSQSNASSAPGSTSSSDPSQASTSAPASSSDPSQASTSAPASSSNPSQASTTAPPPPPCNPQADLAVINNLAREAQVLAGNLGVVQQQLAGLHCGQGTQPPLTQPANVIVRP